MQLPRGHIELTDDEVVTQVRHILHKLKPALNYVVSQMQDPDQYNSAAAASFEFNLPGVQKVAAEVKAIRQGDKARITVCVNQPRDCHQTGHFPQMDWPLADYSRALGDLFQSLNPIEIGLTQPRCPYFVIALDAH